MRAFRPSYFVKSPVVDDKCRDAERAKRVVAYSERAQHEEPLFESPATAPGEMSHCHRRVG